MSDLPPLDQLKELQQRITPGPWFSISDLYDIDMTYIYDGAGQMCLSLTPIGSGSSYQPGDLEVAALAPALLAEVIRLRQKELMP
ncbi:hypothetical protein [Corynebacterium ulceribovis]|uniref:hypothetical protein n=1 Tax=Corynebacterium ulceribovis TaxID=487732 RepID=UPI0003737D18|nr:hypothetical protein [Corynebacterium ulceribovis]